ncbi:MAG TPA: hypothetical protein VK789_05275 [Bryobacteraceae bacterium]|jgi:hypothetical protein|nr:hypothetical protein [Bryobacteraceae bacterium]
MYLRTTTALLLLAPALFAQNAPAPAGGAPARPQRVAPPARIASFKAQPESIEAGQAAVLVWATENPNSVTITPDIGRVAARGTRQVLPATTTTYVLTVAGPNNTSLTQSVTVTVSGKGKSATISSNGQHPDLSGVYNFAGVRGLAPPVLKAGAEKYKIQRGGPGDVRGNTTLGTDCVPLGIPQSFVTPYPFQMIQTPTFILQIFEYPNTFRYIWTDGRPHPADPDPTWNGDATAKWDGDTLVVDSVGFNDKTEVSGYMHSEALHVIERYKRVSTGLQYDVTVEDPNVFASAWVLPQRILPARPDLDRVDEFVCENKIDYSKYFGTPQK